MCIPHPCRLRRRRLRRRKRCKDKDYFRIRKPIPPFCAFFLRNRAGNCRRPFRSVTKSFPPHPHTLIENPVNLLPLFRLGSQMLCPSPRQKTETPAPDGKTPACFGEKRLRFLQKAQGEVQHSVTDGMGLRHKRNSGQASGETCPEGEDVSCARGARGTGKIYSSTLL